MRVNRLSVDERYPDSMRRIPMPINPVQQTLPSPTASAPRSLATTTLVAAAALLGACGSAPLSFLDGDLQVLTSLDLHPVRVVSIDGDVSQQNPRQISPGMHTIIVATTFSGGGAGARAAGPKAYAIRVAPCTRYYLAARRLAQLGADWEMITERTEAVAGCDPAEELKKSGLGSTLEVSPGLARASR
jgi:hypothetical protein